MEVAVGLALVMAGLCYVALFPRAGKLQIAAGGAANKRAPKRKLGAPDELAVAALRTGAPKRDRTAQFGRR